VRVRVRVWAFTNVRHTVSVSS